MFILCIFASHPKKFIVSMAVISIYQLDSLCQLVNCWCWLVWIVELVDWTFMTVFWFCDTVFEFVSMCLTECDCVILSLTVCGYFKLCLTVFKYFDCLSPCMIVYNNIWLFETIFEWESLCLRYLVWQFMSLRYSLWLYVTVFDCVKLCLSCCH